MKLVEHDVSMINQVISIYKDTDRTTLLIWTILKYLEHLRPY